MKNFPKCIIQYTRNNKYHHELTKTHLAAKHQYYSQQGKKN